MICDFCSSPDVRWRYPARDFTRSVMGVVDAGSRGDWAACDACHRLIRLSLRDKLVERCLKRYPLYAALSKTEKISARRELRAIHDDFWASREGAPEPLEVSA
jgi:hypothetical protein